MVDGAINADIFAAFVEQVLLVSLNPGDIVVMDNLSSHKCHRIRELINSVGASVLYLPAYSPDFNPIEMAFSKLKQLMRSAAHRSKEALWNGMQQLLDQITTSDAAAFFRHCGYAIEEK